MKAATFIVFLGSQIPTAAGQSIGHGSSRAAVVGAVDQKSRMNAMMSSMSLRDCHLILSRAGSTRRTGADESGSGLMAESIAS
jgi:hypothetical protein